MRAVVLAVVVSGTAPATAGPLSAPAPSRFVADGCLPVCQTNCLKPFAIPDRWDDGATVAGHDDWRSNGRWDREDFGDLNANELFDPGETFTDSNGNRRFDSEAYHSILTGYIPDPYPGNTLSPNGDLGLQILLKYGSGDRIAASHYLAIELPAVNRGTPVGGARAYRDHLEGCLQAGYVYPGDWLQLEPGNMAGPTAAGVQALIAKDPAARYDPATKEIVGSIHPAGESPRLVIVGFTDPRIGGKSGRSRVQLVKLAAFFVEELDDAGSVRGRFLKTRALAPPCDCCGDLRVNWLRSCP